MATVALFPSQRMDQIQILEPVSAEGEQCVYLVRHGESTSNICDPVTGIQLTSGKSLEITLTNKGKDQAVLLGDRLASLVKKGTQVVICTSTACRAQQTALTIFNQLKKTCSCEMDLPYEGLCELGQGPWEGKPKDNAYEAELNKWKNRSAYDKWATPKVNGGENYQSVAERFLPDLDTIVKKHKGKMIFAISHYAAINAAFLRMNFTQQDLSQTPQSKLPEVGLENCDMLEVRIFQKGEKKAVMHISTGIK